MRLVFKISNGELSVPQEEVVGAGKENSVNYIYLRNGIRVTVHNEYEKTIETLRHVMPVTWGNS